MWTVIAQESDPRLGLGDSSAILPVTQPKSLKLELEPEKRACGAWPKADQRSLAPSFLPRLPAHLPGRIKRLQNNLHLENLQSGFYSRPNVTQYFN